MKRVDLVSLALAWTIPAPAAAQTSDTTCSRLGQFVNCHTTTQSQPALPDYLGAMHTLPDPAESFLRGQQEAEHLRQQRLQNQLLAQQQAVDQSHAAAMAEVQAEVAKRLRDGDCKGAVDLALLSGDIDTATKAKTFCAKPTQ